jgi:hypothetical protein
MWRACMSNSPATAAKFSASTSAKKRNWTSSMYGSWLPAGSTPMKYGLRRSVKIASEAVDL